MASDSIITASPSEMLIMEILTMGREKLFLSLDKMPRAMKSSKFKVKSVKFQVSSFPPSLRFGGQAGFKFVAKVTKMIFGCLT